MNEDVVRESIPDGSCDFEGLRSLFGLLIALMLSFLLDSGILQQYSCNKSFPNKGFASVLRNQSA